jgi:predicted nucleic acid-binding protein
MARARRNVVDSSAWLAYFAGEPGAGHFSAAIEDTANLVVPTVCLLEVFKVVARQRDDGDALQAVALMQQARIMDLDANIAVLAAKASLDHKLPLTDAVVYATAVFVDGLVWTQDEDFKGLPDVRFYQKKTR